VTARVSFELARQVSQLNWEAEWSYLELLNTSQVEVFTGESDWDVAFMLSHRQAILNLLPHSQHLPNPSYVTNRLPDQGYSHRGDGSDYNHSVEWTVTSDVNYLSGFLLPAKLSLLGTAAELSLCSGTGRLYRLAPGPFRATQH
jgi:hypothetical protein